VCIQSAGTGWLRLKINIHLREKMLQIHSYLLIFDGCESWWWHDDVGKSVVDDVIMVGWWEMKFGQGSLSSTS